MQEENAVGVEKELNWQRRPAEHITAGQVVKFFDNDAPHEVLEHNFLTEVLSVKNMRDGRKYDMLRRNVWQVAI